MKSRFFSNQTCSIFTTLLLVCISSIVHAQSQTFEGRVIDAKTRKPIVYASIGVVGFNIGTISNEEGAFTLKVPASLNGKISIKISCIGYESKVLQHLEAQVEVELKESATILKEVVVRSKEINPRHIVNRFFKSIKKNYYSKPFQYKLFYRHYCKDDSTYGRLIEAAIDFYKRKGQKSPQPFPGLREEVRVTQLRRSFDNTKVAIGHAPIAFYSCVAADPVGYQSRSSYRIESLLISRFNISHLKKDLKKFTFELEGITEFDGEEVYVIRYRSAKDTLRLSTGIPLVAREYGRLYITAKNFALVKIESVKKGSFDSTKFLVSYKKVNGRYFLSHSLEEGHSFYPQAKLHHQFHVEVTTIDIQLRNFEPFRGKEPVREELLSIDYDSAFWKQYNILKATPLEEKIVKDLEQKQSLKNQYGDFVKEERERVLGGKEDEERFNKMLKDLSGKGRPILLDFWATWCGPCMAQIDYSKELYEKYKGKVFFIYLSIDSDWKKWKEVVEKHQLKGLHFRIGPTSDAADLFDVNSIPRYVLLDQNGSLININASRPSDPELSRQIDRVLEAQDNGK